MFFSRLKEVAERLNRFGYSPNAALSNLKSGIKRIVLGPAHIAILFDDGQICRVSFSVISDRLDLSKNDPVKRYVRSDFHKQSMDEARVELGLHLNCVRRNQRNLVVFNSSSGSGGAGSGGTGGSGGGTTGTGGSGTSGGSKPAGSGSSSSSRQITRRARIMRSSNTAIRGGSHSSKIFSFFLLCLRVVCASHWSDSVDVILSKSFPDEGDTKKLLFEERVTFLQMYTSCVILNKGTSEMHVMSNGTKHKMLFLLCP